MSFPHRTDIPWAPHIVHLAPIEGRTRRAEAEFRAAFEETRPRILGALLDAVVGTIRELPNVRLEELPRMADFADWAGPVA